MPVIQLYPYLYICWPLWPHSLVLPRQQHHVVDEDPHLYDGLLY